MEIHAKSKFEVGDKVWTPDGEREVSEVYWNDDGDGGYFTYAFKRDENGAGWTVCCAEGSLGRTQAEAHRNSLKYGIVNLEKCITAEQKSLAGHQEKLKEMEKELAEYK